ncbi:unnamed protein product [Cunninghamella echinulata]
MTIVRIANSKRTQQAMLALTLLDHCVKNCGYPFHLQIATKEFLNALVRKFPERPPSNYSPPASRLHSNGSDGAWNHFDYVPEQPVGNNPVMSRILYLIKEWKIGLAELSRYKNDLIHIKDMYRLLRYKGYRFPEIKQASLAALTPVETLRSTEEIEEEDRIAQGAKLQELIRRGRPQDLVEANRLMKIMTGYDQKKIPNYSEMFIEELQKIENKAILLYEMLENVKPGEKLNANEVMRDLEKACATALPKISKLVKEEEDEEKIDELLRVNDIVNNTIAKFKDIQNGLYDTHYKVKEGHATPQSSQQQPISLIDLDEELNNQSNSLSTGNNNKNTLDELSDVFGQQMNMNNTPTPHPETILDLSQQQTNIVSSTALTDDNLVGNNNKNQRIQDLLSNEKVNNNDAIAAVNEIVLIDKNGLSIILHVTQSTSLYNITAYFSNKSTADMENMTLHLAVPKSMKLIMGVQSSQIVPAKSNNSVHQDITIENPMKQAIRLRYKVTYDQFGVQMEQSGELS